MEYDEDEGLLWHCEVILPISQWIFLHKKGENLFKCKYNMISSFECNVMQKWKNYFYLNMFVIGLYY